MKEEKAANERTDERVASAVPPNINTGGGGDNGASQASVGITKEKMRRTVAQQGLNGATITKLDDDMKQATQGELSDNFKDACLEPTVTTATRGYRKSLVIFADSAARTRDYLKRMIFMPHLTTVVITLMMMMNYKDTPLDEDLPGLKKVLSVLNSLVADESDSKYVKQASAQATVDLEETLGQSEVKRQRMFTKGFVDGCRDSKEAVLTLITNMTCKLEQHFNFDPDQPRMVPTVVSMLITLADKMMTPEARKWHNKLFECTLWIPIMRSTSFIPSWCNLRRLQKFHV